MRIIGSEADAWLEFEPLREISDHSYAITAAIAGYRVANNSVALFETASFLAELADFEQRRRGEALLVGTYDFELHVSPYLGRGDALLRLRLADTLPPVGNVYGSCRLEGAFVVPGESVGTLVDGLRRMLIA